jgi:thymidylate synthase
MNKADKYFLKSLKRILKEKNMDVNPRPKYKDGVPAHSYFITQVFETYDISKGEFPIPTLRNTAIKTGIKEVLWIYQKQDSKLSTAHDMGIMWWDEWNIGDDTIGMRYGATINKWDLMNKLLNNLKNDPFSRRHVINMLQESDLKESLGLYPCAFETEWSVRKKGKDFYLDLFLNQRSNDFIVAGAINKIQYVALQMMVANHCGYKVGKFSHYVNNLHIYDRHLDAAKEILSKKPLDIQPKIELLHNKNFYDYTIDDFKVYDTDKIEKLKSNLELAI